MAKKIRVHTLALPFDDSIASFILSNDEYDVLISERTPLPKSGVILFHIQYQDNSESETDEVADLLAAQRAADEEKSKNKNKDKGDPSEFDIIEGSFEECPDEDFEDEPPVFPLPPAKKGKKERKKK